MATAENKMQDAKETLVLALAFAGDKTFYRVKHKGTMGKLMKTFAKRIGRDASSLPILGQKALRADQQRGRLHPSGDVLPLGWALPATR